MFARHPHSSAAHLLAALAVTLTLGLAGGAAKPAAADATQWTRSQPSWSNANGWNRQWRSQWHHRNPWHHRHLLSNRPQIVIGGGSGIIIAGPGFVVGSPGIIVRRPGFFVGQPGIVMRQPSFIYQRPHFAWRQQQFFRRHPSLHAGQPWWHKTRKHQSWKHHHHWQHNNHWQPDNSWRHNGMRFTTPGMRFTTPGMGFTTPGMRFTTP